MKYNQVRHLLTKVNNRDNKYKIILSYLKKHHIHDGKIDKFKRLVKLGKEIA